MDRTGGGITIKTLIVINLDYLVLKLGKKELKQLRKISDKDI